MAVDSLRSVAGLLTEAYAPLHAIMARRSDVPEAAAPDTVFTTVKATSDVRRALPARPPCCSCRETLCWAVSLLEPPWVVLRIPQTWLHALAVEQAFLTCAPAVKPRPDARSSHAVPLTFIRESDQEVHDLRCSSLTLAPGDWHAVISLLPCHSSVLVMQWQSCSLGSCQDVCSRQSHAPARVQPPGMVLS